ncbi:MAG: MFS transporter [Actinobacteria bacterium]|nr:MFS transporter [Actinomycetota bacterium]
MSRKLGFFFISFVFLVNMFGTTLPTPLYPLFQQRYSFGVLMVTVVFAIYAFGVIAGLLLFGAVSDEIGRKPVLAVGLAFSAASAFLFVFADSLAPIYAGRILSGLSAGIFTGTATAALVDLVPGDRRRLATLISIVVNLGGRGLGALAAGLIGDYGSSPLRLPFVIDLGLIGVAAVALWLTPETVRDRRFRLRLQRLAVPHEVRSVFIRGAAAGFASFAVAGLFSSVAPAFLGQVLGEPSHTLAGALVFILFAASILGQLAVPRLSDRRALVSGCVLMAGGVGLVALGLGLESLSALIASSAVVGLGQGLVIGAGLAAINERAPVARRGETASSFFVVMYVGLSLPVIGIGVAAEGLGLKTAGIAFSAVVAVLVLAVLASLARR